MGPDGKSLASSTDRLQNHMIPKTELRGKYQIQPDESLGPVNTTGVDGVADENRARTGPPRTALGPWGGDEAEDEGLGYS
jgi:hypothetical protein